MKKLTELQRHLKPGMVYRRSDLEKWSTSVDRHIQEMLDSGYLIKLSAGLYMRPKHSVFGLAPAEDDKVVQAFLKDSRFLITSPNAYNSLGVGTTQLYNKIVVYNHKRHGVFKLGNRTYEFRRVPYFPTRVTEEFLLVDLVNNLDTLAEDTSSLLRLVKHRATTMNPLKLKRAAHKFGKLRAHKLFDKILAKRQKTPDTNSVIEKHHSKHQMHKLHLKKHDQSTLANKYQHDA